MLWLLIFYHKNSDIYHELHLLYILVLYILFYIFLVFLLKVYDEDYQILCRVFFYKLDKNQVEVEVLLKEYLLIFNNISRGAHRPLLTGLAQFQLCYFYYAKIYNILLSYLCGSQISMILFFLISC